MPQIFLSSDALPNGLAAPAGPLSRREKDAGKIIDINALLPGDLILTSSVKPGFVASLIRKVQLQGGYQEEHARWEHAAVYIGDGVICEATRSGVNRQMLAHYVGSHHFCFRRDNALTLDERYKIAIAALSLNDYSYDIFEIFRLFKIAARGFGDRNNSLGRPVGFPKQAVICSLLYADSYGKVTKRILGNVAGGEVTPASLSVDMALSDVGVNWLKIPT